MRNHMLRASSAILVGSYTHGDSITPWIPRTNFEVNNDAYNAPYNSVHARAHRTDGNIGTTIWMSHVVPVVAGKSYRFDYTFPSCETVTPQSTKGGLFRNIATGDADPIAQWAAISAAGGSRSDVWLNAEEGTTDVYFWTISDVAQGLANEAGAVGCWDLKVWEL